MATSERSLLKLDHRELAVLFSLFVFLSLLMFTVGILVGKGLSHRTKTTSLEADHHENPISANAALNNAAHAPKSTSVSMGEEIKSAAPAKTVGTVAKVEASPTKQSLELTPMKAKKPDFTGTQILEPKNARDDVLTKNPRLEGIVENESSKNSGSEELPRTSDRGFYTVQVGSYPAEKEAAERTAAFKRMGFPHAFFQSTSLPGTNQIWYRVSLGYFASYDAAKIGGEFLQQKGEIRTFLIRRTDETNRKN